MNSIQQNKIKIIIKLFWSEYLETIIFFYGITCTRIKKCSKKIIVGLNDQTSFPFHSFVRLYQTITLGSVN